jgi:hypothetical protein
VTVRILDAIVGDEALAAIKAANPYNRDPAEGTTYVLIRPEVVAAGDLPPRTVWEDLGAADWAVAGKGFTVPPSQPPVFLPAPAFGGRLKAGGRMDGWVAFEVPGTLDLIAGFEVSESYVCWFELPEHEAR